MERLTSATKSIDDSNDHRCEACLALPCRGGRLCACPALHNSGAKPGASSIEPRSRSSAPERRSTKARASSFARRSSGDAADPTVLGVLGSDPYGPGQVLRALRGGFSVRDVDKALTVLMSRREARILINSAKAALARKPWAMD